jgi:mRNA interferase RelE/StbE
MYDIEIRRNARKALDKLQIQDRQRVISALLDLEQNPRPVGIEKIKGTGLWRIREGDYRLVYYINDEEKKIVIVRIGHRRDIYRYI